jgi:hypothetical protein
VGVSDAVPPEPVRSVDDGSAPEVALLKDFEPVIADAGSGPSSAVREILPVSLLMENSEPVRSVDDGSPPGVASLKDFEPVIADAGSGPSSAVRKILPVSLPASQARLDGPVGSPVQARRFETAVDGSTLMVVSLSDSKRDCSPAIREAFSLPWEEDLSASPWEEVSGSGVAATVEAPVSETSLVKDVRPSSQAPSLIRREFFGPMTVSSPSGPLREKILSRRLACSGGGF